MIASNLTRFAARKTAIAQAQPGRFATVQRAAEQLSLRVVDLATVELMAEALAGATALAYERDDSGHLVNVDTRTGRVLYPVPWGRAGHRQWGLAPSECNLLRLILQRRQGEAALWLYDGSRRAWYVNRQAFRTLDMALEHLRQCPLTIAELRAARGALAARRVGGAVGR